MEWERAKNYIIVFFILLNATLGILLTIENRRYTITSDQERLIRTVLSRNNIIMYRMPMRQFSPMRPIEVTGFYYSQEDIEALVEILFENPQDVEHTYNLGNHRFVYGNISLEITSGFITYKNPYGFRQAVDNTLFSLPNEDVTYGSAVRLTDIFVNNYFPDFVQDGRPTEEGGGIRIIYLQEYHGQLILSNSIEFLVTPVGIYQIEMEFGQILGHTGTPLMIFSPDEALFAFAQRVSPTTQETPKTIASMDLVYFNKYFSYQYGPYHAVPFYRIFTRCQIDQPFLVNAFTNETMW